jgi:pimeloyl-ACP methyl ester carboxylesterase
VAGWSAGGRVALALAARHPQLVDRLVMLGTPAPHEHVAWIAPEQLSALDALRGLPPSAAYTALLQQLTGLIPHSVESPAALDLLSVSAADAEALARPGARERLTGMLSAAFAQGLGGLAADLAGYTLQPWGFELETVQAKTLLLYGSKDPVAASRHGSWWQKHLPNARLEVVPNAGHLLVIPMWQRVLSHLAPAAKRKL